MTAPNPETDYVYTAREASAAANIVATAAVTAFPQRTPAQHSVLRDELKTDAAYDAATTACQRRRRQALAERVATAKRSPAPSASPT